MIERLEGIVDGLIDGGVVVRMGSIYLALQVPRAGGVLVGSSVTLYTQLIWNQETGPHLFGFLSPLERTVFNLVTDCSGIGPKLAMALLEQLGPEVIITALYEGNEQILSSVSGIGTKKAEHMIVHLKVKAHKLIKTGQISNTGSVSYLHEVDSALQSLNYSRGEIQRAMEHIKQAHSQRGAEDTPQPSFDILLRRALAYLTHKQ
jgi:Holliday junction DNA helicase RuvA